MGAKKKSKFSYHLLAVPRNVSFVRLRLPDCLGVKTNGIVTMTKVDRPYVMRTPLSLQRLSARVKLVQSHLSSRCFSILLLGAHQFCLALVALFLMLPTAPVTVSKWCLTSSAGSFVKSLAFGQMLLALRARAARPKAAVWLSMNLQHQHRLSLWRWSHSTALQIPEMEPLWMLA